MTTALQDCPTFEDFALSPHVRRWYIQVLMTAGGATSTITTNLPTLPAVANSASSVFAVTNLPPCPGTPRYNIQIYSPGATVTEAIVTAYSATNGTLSYRTSKAGTATDPASGDIIWLYFEGESRPVP
jgi:hypothetical protein